MNTPLQLCLHFHNGMQLSNTIILLKAKRKAGEEYVKKALKEQKK